jgi:hypothetical protein
MKWYGTILSEVKSFGGTRRCKILFIGSLIAFFLSVIAYVPKWQLTNYQDIALLEGKEKILLEDNLRQTLIKLIGGTIVLIGLYLTYRRMLTSERQVVTMESGQMTDRFTRATDQLGAIDNDGNPNIPIRLGGIYALEQITNDRPDKFFWTVMEIFSAYVRHNAPRKESTEDTEEKASEEE